MSKKENQPAASDYNLKKLSTEELVEHLPATIKFGENIAIFASRGTGKTVISKNAIKRTKVEHKGQMRQCRELYWNMSVQERTDMAGFPRIFDVKDGDFVRYLLPETFKTLMEGDDPVVALLDEVDKADTSLHAPLLEFTQFHTINGRHIPNLQAVIMTGNLISEGSQRPSLPLLDRAEKYLIEPDAASWLKWAGSEGKIHPSITAYINDHQDKLFGNANPEDRYADPSPRGWERASQILVKGEALNLRSDVLNTKVAGCVGKQAGLEYSFYFEHYQELLPLVDEIFRGPKSMKDIHGRYNKLNPTKKIVACMIVCSRIATILDKNKSEDASKKLKETSYVGKFLQGVEPENILVSVRSQIQLPKIIEHKLDLDKDWEPFFDLINKQMSGKD